MRLPVIKHDDERRTLTEYISDIPFKRAKIIESKGAVTVGNHYHNHNDSVFYLFKGKAKYLLKFTDGGLDDDWLFEGDCLFVPRYVIHKFELTPNTIMLETASEPYDPQDEIQAFI